MQVQNVTSSFQVGTNGSSIEDLAEASLEQSEALFRQLFEESADAKLFWKDGVFTNCNRAAISMMRCQKKAELLSLHPAQLSPDVQPDGRSSLEKADEMAAIALSKGNHRFEWVFRRRDGEEFWVEVLLTRIDWDGTSFLHTTWRDISERVRAEAERKAIEAELQRKLQILNASNDAIIIRQLDGVITDWNQGAQRLYGWTPQECIGKKTHTLFQTIFPKPLEAIMSDLEQQGYWEGELIHLLREGRQVVVFSRWTLYRDEQGRPTAILETNNDITARKQVEEALRISEQRFRDVTEAAGEYIWELNAEGRYTFLTDRVKDVRGYSPAEMLGYTPMDFMVPQEIARVEAIIKMAAAKKLPFTFEHPCLLPSGELGWELVSGLPILDEQGEIVGFRGTGLSITARKQAEAELRKREAQLRSINTTVPGVIFQHTTDLRSGEGRFTYMNPRAVDLYEIEADVLMTNSALAWEVIHPDDLEQFQSKVMESIQHRTSWFDEFRIITPSGEVKWVRGQADPGEAPEGFAINNGVLFDVSDRKAAQIALEQKAQELEQALQELQRTQLQMIQAEKMSSLGQLVAGIAHEINNPVNFIYGNIIPTNQYTQDLLKLIQLYQTHYPNPTPAIQQEIQTIDLEFVQQDLPKILSSMRMGADRIRQIVSSLRTFSRLDEAEYKEVNIHEGIDSTLVILENRLKTKPDYPQIQVVKHYGDLPLVECYAGQLNQAFLNILTNAIDALEERDQHRSLPEISQFPSKIRISTKVVHSDRVVICIADNGPGIPTAIKQRIFDPFFTTKPVGKGTGMGMSISYQIITENHKGSLKCFSTPGRGTRFVIEIPLQQKK